MLRKYTGAFFYPVYPYGESDFGVSSWLYPYENQEYSLFMDIRCGALNG
jgi:hypothetical protein